MIRQGFLPFALLLFGAAVLTACGQPTEEKSPPADKTGTAKELVPVTFATDWVAQAEQGGFYQALAQGLYEERGLKVTIRQGGAGVNIPQLLAAGAVDLGMGSNSFIPLNIVKAGAPIKVVMASFQKDPQVLITHPRDDITSLEDMRGRPIMIADASRTAFWLWLEAKYGFEESQIRKYSGNVAPFLVDENAIQQGYLTSEPYIIERELGEPPQVFLLADYGYPGYAAMVMAREQMIEEKPEVVRAFVEATIEGWRSYLYGDPAPGNALILEDNPDMTREILDQAVEKLRRYNMAGTGEAGTEAIGAMTDARWDAFFEVMAGAGVYEQDLPYKEAYTLQFVSPDP